MSVREITIDDLKVAMSGGAVALGTVPDNMELFRSDADVYVVCHSGGRSMRACEFLHDQGITNVVNVNGGTSGWIALGNPATTGQQS